MPLKLEYYFLSSSFLDSNHPAGYNANRCSIIDSIPGRVMPLDYTAIQNGLHTLSSQVAARLADEQKKASRAVILLDSLAGQNDHSREIIMAASASNTNLRSAVPTDEEITASFSPPGLAQDYTLLAADGS